MIERDFKTILISCVKAFTLFISVIILTSVKSPADIKLFSLWVMFLNLFYVFLSSRNRFTFIVSALMFWFNYSIFFTNYYAANRVFFASDAMTTYAVQGYKVILLFSQALCILVKQDNKKEYDYSTKLFDSDNRSFSVSYFFIVVLAAILVFGFTRPTEFGERGTPSALFEYSTIVFIVGFYFFNKCKAYKFLSFILLGAYVITNLYYGGRVTALQLLIIAFLFIEDGKKIAIIKILPIGFLLLAVFVVVGSFRGNWILGSDRVRLAISAFLTNGLSLDTAGSAYYTSLSFLKVEKVSPFRLRFSLFIKWILYLFVGSSIPNSNLAQYTRQYYVHYYGGVLPFFGEFYLGFVGIILFAILVSVYSNEARKISNNSSGIAKCLIVYFTSAVPRWYLYAPTALLRGAMFLALFYFCTKLAVEATQR